MRPCHRDAVAHLRLYEHGRVGNHARKADLDAFEIYIAGKFAPLITNAARWNNPATQAVIPVPRRAEVEQILVRRGIPTADQFAGAEAAVERFFHKPPEVAAQEALQRPNLFVAALTVGYGTTVIFVIIPSLIASLLFQGGALVKLLGIVFVRRDGRPASRWRRPVADSPATR